MAVITGSTPKRTELKIATGRVTKPMPLRKLVTIASSKETTKAKMKEATTAGSSRRSVISRQARVRLAPRLNAASSSSRGTRAIAAPVMRSTNGSASVTWTTSIPPKLPSSRRSAKSP